MHRLPTLHAETKLSGGHSITDFILQGYFSCTPTYTHTHAQTHAHPRLHENRLLFVCRWASKDAFFADTILIAMQLTNIVQILVTTSTHVDEQ